MPASTYAARIDELAAAADEERARPDPDPPADSRARYICREGVGPTVALYVEARTGGRNYRFDEAAFRRLEATLNDWLELYARCYGVDLTAEFTLREAAELLVETHDATEVAQLLTRVPERC